jgi:hypothetical protein
MISSHYNFAGKTKTREARLAIDFDVERKCVHTIENTENGWQHKLAWFKSVR